MLAQPLSSNPQSGSSVTGTNRSGFIETIEYKRFVEFCDACRRYRYIGLCFGAPGIGKTLSAARYSRAEMLPRPGPLTDRGLDQEILDTVFCTPAVVNTPGSINAGLRQIRETLLGIAKHPVRTEARRVLDALRRRDQEWRRQREDTPGSKEYKEPPLEPTYYATLMEYEAKKAAVSDPTTLILIDEADRLGMASLEQVRSIFDEGGAGLILIGIPGIEKRMARFPQFYSRIGFVHEYRPLGAAEIQNFLAQGWAPDGVSLCQEAFSADVLGAIVRMTGGNSRLLNRLLTQIERVMHVNETPTVTLDIVQAARDSLVVGQS